MAGWWRGWRWHGWLVAWHGWLTGWLGCLAVKCGAVLFMPTPAAGRLPAAFLLVVEVLSLSVPEARLPPGSLRRRAGVAESGMATPGHERHPKELERQGYRLPLHRPPAH